MPFWKQIGFTSTFYKFNKALNIFLKENKGKYEYTYEKRNITKEAYKDWMQTYIGKRGTSKINDGIQRETSVSSTASFLATKGHRMRALGASNVKDHHL